jgi:hypothetical protein
MVLRMAQRSLPAAAGKPSIGWLGFDIGVSSETVVAVFKGDELVRSFALTAGRHNVQIPVEEALRSYTIRANNPMVFTSFNYGFTEQPDLEKQPRAWEQMAWLESSRKEVRFW